MRDDLGDRIKNNYEARTRYYLPRRTYTILRLDGCHFRSYTKGLNKPFDYDLYEDIDKAIIATLPEIQGAVFAYTQSDEISILLTDFTAPSTAAWFDGNIQKICSVAASIFTAQFMFLRAHRMKKQYESLFTEEEHKFKIALFDARVFTIPDRIEVMNYFIWRNQDCARNSLSSIAQANFSHAELQGKNILELHKMLKQKGINWELDFSNNIKYGRLITKEIYSGKATWNCDNNSLGELTNLVYRTRWVSKDAWKFTEDKETLLLMIPHNINNFK